MTQEKTMGMYSIEEFKKIQSANIERGLQRVSNAGVGPNTGLRQNVTTLTDIIAGVVETLFYETPNKLSDYVPIEVGKGAYAERLFQYAISYKGNAGKQGLINPSANGINKDAQSTLQMGSFEMVNNFWRWDYTLTNELMNMARVNTVNFSIVEENEKARKKVWDLMLQDAWFEGLGDGVSYGLLNQPNVTVNTTALPAKLSNMTDAQFDTFLATIPDAFGRNALYTMTFNRMVIPTSDFFGLTKPYGTFGLNRLQVLEEAFKRVVGGDFQILHSKYGETANANGNGARYVFYKHDADVICGYLPVPYTPMPLFPQGSLDLISQAHGQFVTPFAKRTNGILYVDQQVG